MGFGVLFPDGCVQNVFGFWLVEASVGGCALACLGKREATILAPESSKGFFAPDSPEPYVGSSAPNDPEPYMDSFAPNCPDEDAAILSNSEPPEPVADGFELTEASVGFCAPKGLDENRGAPELVAGVGRLPNSKLDLAFFGFKSSKLLIRP